MGVNRYYEQYTETHKIFASHHKNSWQVFDRQHSDARGACLPIAMCTSRVQAEAIRSSMNTCNDDQ